VKLHSDPRPFYNTFTAYGEGFVEVNEKRYSQSILVLPEGDVLPWPVHRFELLVAGDFEAIVQLKPEILVFGTGASLRFLHPRMTRQMTAAGIGVETMDMFAACRTYNILMSEERKVTCALLIESSEQPGPAT
jgi:uncharacterized protein